jgi:hypothetical protein
MQLFQTRNDMIETLVPKHGTYAEIGVFEGTFSKQIEKILQPSILFMIDLFTGICGSGDHDGNNFINRDLDKEYLKLIEYSHTHPCIRLLKGKSTDILSTLPDNSLDMVYIDGDHSYEGCKKDLQAGFQKIKHGGWIMGHDYEMNMVKARTSYVFGVKQAVDEFCNNYRQTIVAKGLDGCVSYAIQVVKN